MTQQEKEEKLKAFLNGRDFMKLGQALNSKNWQIAMMTVRRMEQTVKELEITAMERNLMQIRHAVLSQNTAEGLNGLTLLVAKRVQMLKSEKGMK